MSWSNAGFKWSLFAVGVVLVLAGLLRRFPPGPPRQAVFIILDDVAAPLADPLARHELDSGMVLVFWEDEGQVRASLRLDIGEDASVFSGLDGKRLISARLTRDNLLQLDFAP